MSEPLLTPREPFLKQREEFRQLRIAKLREFAGALEACFEKTNDAMFRNVLQFCEETGAATPAELADLIGVSRGTVSRWINGKTIPHPVVRPTVIERIREQALARARDLEAEQKSDGDAAKNENQSLVTDSQTAARHHDRIPAIG